jgi:hypothetical protein
MLAKIKVKTEEKMEKKISLLAINDSPSLFIEKRRSRRNWNRNNRNSEVILVLSSNAMED